MADARPRSVDCFPFLFLLNYLKDPVRDAILDLVFRGWRLDSSDLSRFIYGLIRY